VNNFRNPLCCRSLNILLRSAAALAWAHGERPPPESTDEDRPLALPPFLSDSEVADASISCLPGSFDPEKLRGIMREHGFAIVTDVLSAQECSDLTVCMRSPHCARFTLTFARRLSPGTWPQLPLPVLQPLQPCLAIFRKVSARTSASCTASYRGAAACIPACV